MAKKKNASLDALAAESGSPVNFQEEPLLQDTVFTTSQTNRGRPKKLQGKRHQMPIYIPEPLYFELLDWVNLQKRSNKSFSINDIIIDAMDLWLESHGKPSIKELVRKSG